MERNLKPIPTGEIYVSRAAMPDAEVGHEYLWKVRMRVVRVDDEEVLLTLAPLVTDDSAT